MEYFVPIESDTSRYHQFQALGLFFGTAFFFGGIYLILFEDAKITINGEIQEANFSSTWPFLLIGIGAIGLAIYHSKKICKATLYTKGIVLHNKKDKLIEWEDIVFAEIKHFIVDYCIRIHTKDGGQLNLQPDRPKGFSFNDAFQPDKAYLRTKMWQKINEIITSK